MMSTSLKARTPGGTALAGTPFFHEFCLQKPHKDLRVRIGEKSSHASGMVRGKVVILKYTHSVLLSNSLSSRKTTFPELTQINQCGFYQSLTDMGEWKYPTPASPSLPVSPKEVNKKLRCTCEGQRLRTNSTSACFPSSQILPSYQQGSINNYYYYHYNGSYNTIEKL